MPSTLAAPLSALPPEQRPRVYSLRPSKTSAGDEAVDLARMAGLVLDPWEEMVLRESLGERPDGKWSAFEVGVMVSRQNGKGAILEARELAGLFLLNEGLIIHSAHQFDTSLEHFRRLKHLVENTPEFSRRVKKNGIKNSHGEEGIELVGGQRIRFRTRTKGGGRGFTGDLVVFDEAMDIPASTHGAVLPVLSSKSVHGNPQVWYTGSAVDQWIHDNGIVFARVRARGHKGDDPDLAYFEWSVGAENPEELGDEATTPAAWNQANPALGIRISEDHVGREHRSMDPRTFAVERLGVGDWPNPDGTSKAVIAPEVWDECADVKSKLLDPVRFAFDVTPDRSSSSIAVSGLRKDGRKHVEVIERRSGTGWVAKRLADLQESHDTSGNPICDGAGPAASLISQMEDLGLEIEVVNAKEHAQACGVFFDACDQAALRHLDTQELNAALKGAVKRPLGDAWAWSRRSSTVDISPLVAVTLALWGASQKAVEVKPLIALR